MNNIHKHLEFKITEEENNNINYFDLNIHRHNNKLNIEIYSKPTQTNHHTFHIQPNKKKQLSFFYINTEKTKQQEWNTILTIAKNNGFPLHIIHNLKIKLMNKTPRTFTIQTHQKKKNGSHSLITVQNN